MKPLWKEGQFIMPQHLQLFDEYHEGLLDTRVSTLQEYGWGIAELDIDQGELARGLFRLESCTAVMPDGLHVEVDSERPLQGIVALTGGALAGGKSELDLFLAVPGTESRGTPNYAGDGKAAGTRYVSTPVELSDIYGSSAPTAIDCLDPNVQLLMGHQNRQNYVSIKLARLKVGKSGSLRISDAYIPPCLKIRASRALMDRLARLVSLLGAKQKDLSERYGGRVGNMLEFGAADMATFWYMHTINTWLPMLLHYSKEGHVHPERLYLALLSLAGQLNSFEVGSTPEDLPSFQFLDLASTFLPLFDRLFELLGTVVASRYTTIDLEQRQAGLFVGQPPDPNLMRMNALYLVAGGDVPDEVLRKKLPNFLKVGSYDQIRDIVHAALPGVECHVDLSPPAAIPVKANMLYMRLEKGGPQWDSVVNTNNIAIYQPVTPDRIKLELLAVEA